MTVTPIPDDDPLAIPRALRRVKGDHAAEWAGREVTTTAGAAPPGRDRGEEDPATAAFRAEIEAEKKARAQSRIAKMKARLADKSVDRTGQRWDSLRNRWVDDRPPTLPTREELAAMDLHLEEKDFIVMNGPDMVRWYNQACELAQKHRMASYRPVKKFESKEAGAKRCAFLAHALRAAAAAGDGRGPEHGSTGVTGHCKKCGAVSGSCDHTRADAACTYPACKCVVETSTNQPEPVCPKGLKKKELYKPEETGEDVRPPFLRDKTDGAPAASAAGQEPESERGETMAKRAKKAANGEGGYRIKGKSAKAVAEFKPVRAGTDRATVLKMAAQKSTADLETIAKELGCEPKYIAVHLYSLHRDSGIGYDVDAKGSIELKFPGSKTVKDAIVQKAAE